MTIQVSEALLAAIHVNGETAYPEEGAGLLLGRVDGDIREAAAIYALSNAREDGARHNRYLLTPQDMLRGEQEAARQGLDVIGIFHSHPDHPNRPSDFDRDWALPWYSYIITCVEDGKALASRSWRLREDRSQFDEEDLTVIVLKEK